MVSVCDRTVICISPLEAVFIQKRHTSLFLLLFSLPGSLTAPNTKRHTQVHNELTAVTSVPSRKLNKLCHIVLMCGVSSGTTAESFQPSPDGLIVNSLIVSKTQLSLSRLAVWISHHVVSHHTVIPKQTLPCKEVPSVFVPLIKTRLCRATYCWSQSSLCLGGLGTGVRTVQVSTTGTMTLEEKGTPDTRTFLSGIFCAQLWYNNTSLFLLLFFSKVMRTTRSKWRK